MEQTDKKVEEKFIDKLSTIEDLIDEDKLEVSNDELDFIVKLKNKMDYI